MKVLIVEDEIDARKVLKYLLKELFPDIDIVGEAGTVSKAKKLIDLYHPDLVFLDVRLKDGTGLDLLHQCQCKDKFQTIFTTAYANYAIKAIKFNATDYLLKPIDPDELKAAVIKATNQINDKQKMSQLKKEQLGLSHKTILIKTSEQTFLLPVKDIIRLEADGSYTTIITLNNKIITSKNLKFYEKELPESYFIRTHQSHLINKKYIHCITKEGLLKLTNQELIPISFRKKAMVRNLLKNNINSTY